MVVSEKAIGSRATGQPDRVARLVVATINWNGGDDTAACLESLARERAAGSDFECIVVDNASDDGSPQRLAAEFPWARMVCLDTNRGFAGGGNEGIRIAMDEGADLVLLLNNDTAVEPGFIRAMLAAADDPDNSEFGLFTSVITEWEDPDRIWSAGGAVHLATCTIGNRRRLPAHGAAVVRCDFATGCCMMIRRQTIADVGVMDESLFAYVEDVELSLRAARAGWWTGLVPGASMRHRISSSMRRNTLAGQGGLGSATQHYYNIRNRYIVLRRYGSASEKALGLTVHTLRHVGLLLGQLLLGRTNKVAMTARAIADGVRMRGGPAPAVRR